MTTAQLNALLADLSDDAALDRLLDAIEAGETALSAPFGLPAGVGCWYRQGPGEAW